MITETHCEDGDLDQGAPTLTLEEDSGRATPAPAGARHEVFAPGEVLCHRFRVVRFLGQGGMGQVFEARDLELQASVALKVIRPEHARKAAVVERFKREVHLARQVTHPHVCRIFDLFQHQASKGWGADSEPLLFLTMERLSGETLLERLKRDGPFTPREALPLIRDMADALDAAHRAGIVHRDFKSSNVILAAEEGSTRGVVTDFGLARLHRHADRRKQDLENGSSPGGTPPYMAPELFRGEEATVAADIYSLGVVIYEMMTGKRPYPTVATRRHLGQAPPSPRVHRPELGATWEKTLLRCLERDPARRFARAGDVASALTPGKSALRRALMPLTSLAVAGLLALAFLRPAPAPLAHPPRQSGRAVSVRPRPSVAILGFNNLSPRARGDWLATALAETLAAELAAGERLRTIPGEDVRMMKKELRLASTTTLPADTLLRVHEYLGSDLVVSGSYLFQEQEPQILVNLSLQDAVAGETLLAFTEHGSEARLSDMVSRAGARIRDSLGILATAQSTPAAATGLPALPEATRLYARGLARLRLRDYHGARALLEEALDREPRSVRIHVALADCWTGLGYDQRAEAAARRAFELSDKLARRERLLIEARYAETVRDWTRARQIYDSLWTVFPDTPEYGLRLVAAESAGGSPAKALERVEELRQRFAPDPRFDLAEAEAARARADLPRQLAAAARAAEAGLALGAEHMVARARLLQAQALHDLGRIEEAAARMEQVRAIYEGNGDRRSLAEALVDRHDVMWTGEAGIGLSYEEALEIFRQVGDQRGIARVLARIARVRCDENKLTEAGAMLEEALELARHLGNRSVEAEVVNVQAMRAFFQSDFTRSLELFGEAAERARESGNLTLLAGILANYGGVLTDFLHLAEARAALDEGIAIGRNMGSHYALSMNLAKSARILLWTGKLAAAEERCQEAREIARGIGALNIQAMAQSCLGEIYILEGDPGRASRAFQAANHTQQQLHHDPDAYDATFLLVMAKWSLWHRQTAQAEDYLRLAIEAYPGDEDWEKGILLRLAEVRLDQGKLEEAVESYARAAPATTPDTLPPGARRIGARIALASGRVDEARRELEGLAADAAEAGHVLLELESRFELARLLLASGDQAAGRAALASIARQARALGLGSMVERARRARDSDPGRARQ